MKVEFKLTRRVRSLRITKWAENCTNVFFVPKKETRVSGFLPIGR